MPIQAADIADLVTSTLRSLGRGRWTDNSSAYRRTVATQILIKKGKVKFETDGYEIQFNRLTGLGDTARFVGMGAIDQIDVPANLGLGSIPWRHATWNWAWDYREILMNRNESRIVELLHTRRNQALGNMIELFERALWRVPLTTDNVSIYGIPYWIVKSNTATTTNNGFNGTVPSGYTTVGNINPTTDTRWRNYATQYSNVTKDDFVRKARRMAEYTAFKPIVADTPNYETGEKTLFYSNYSLVGSLVEIAESSNENLGKDVAPYEGKVLFMNTPIDIVPELDNDTTNPFYQIPWSVFFVKGLTGSWMKETNQPIVPGQHTMSAVHGDVTLNTLCVDRRQAGVLATDVTMPA